MGIIGKLKSVIFGGGQERDRGTRVSVEQEPAAASERAVKESPPEPEPVESPEAAETPAEAADEPDPGTDADEPVDTINGIGDAYASRLADAGITTVGQLAGADAADLADSTDIAEGRLEGWIDQARAH